MKNKGILAKALALILVLLMCLPMVVACDSGTGKIPLIPLRQITKQLPLPRKPMRVRKKLQKRMIPIRFRFA